jgi:hypothetical protein
MTMPAFVHRGQDVGRLRRSSSLINADFDGIADAAAWVRPLRDFLPLKDLVFRLVALADGERHRRGVAQALDQPASARLLPGHLYRALDRMLEDGLIAEHDRTALQNASSIASLLLTTEALVSEIPEEKKEAPAMPGGGGMGGMY